MTKYWEVDLLIALLWTIPIVLFVAAVWSWWKRERVFRKIPKHMGSTYDASVKMDYKPNVRIVRP